MISLARRTHRLDDFKIGHFCVNILSDRQRDVSIRFAARGDLKWEGLDWRAGAGGAPVLPGSLAVIECAVENVFDAGDHEIIVGRVVNLDSDPVAEPLVYFRGGYHRVDPAS